MDTVKVVGIEIPLKLFQYLQHFFGSGVSDGTECRYHHNYRLGVDFITSPSCSAAWIRDNYTAVLILDVTIIFMLLFSAFYFSKQWYDKQNPHLKIENKKEKYQSFSNYLKQMFKPSAYALRSNPLLLLDDGYVEEALRPEPSYNNPKLDQALSDCGVLRRELVKTTKAICGLAYPDLSARVERIINLGDQDALFNEVWSEYQTSPEKLSAGNALLKKNMQDYIRLFGYLKNAAKGLSLTDIEYNQAYQHSSLAKLNDVFENLSSSYQIG